MISSGERPAFRIRPFFAYVEAKKNFSPISSPLGRSRATRTVVGAAVLKYSTLSVHEPTEMVARSEGLFRSVWYLARCSHPKINVTIRVVRGVCSSRLIM